jgi:uncharacterized membrane protein
MISQPTVLHGLPLLVSLKKSSLIVFSQSFFFLTQCHIDSIPNTSAFSAASNTNNVAVVGGAVGGAAVLLILLLVVLCAVIVIMTLQLRRQRRKFTVAGELDLS